MARLLREAGATRVTDLAVFLWTAIFTISVWVLLIVAVAAVWQAM